MKTVDKALSLLEYFALASPELGLSELARLSKMDKATVLRLLAALRRHGFVEQDPKTRRFRLGAALLRFARLREESFPLARVIKPILDRVARDAGETAHSALLVGDSLHSVLSTEPDRVTRIRIDHERVPLHATASGTAYLAYSAPEIVERVIEGGLEAFTTNTASTGQELKARLAAIVERGYSLSLGSLEKEVVSVGAPLFGALGTPVGTISIACVASRWQPEREKPLARLVTAAALEIAGGIGGEPRRDFVEAARRLMVEEGRR